MGNRVFCCTIFCTITIIIVRQIYAWQSWSHCLMLTGKVLIRLKKVLCLNCYLTYVVLKCSIDEAAIAFNIHYPFRSIFVVCRMSSTGITLQDILQSNSLHDFSHFCTKCDVKLTSNFISSYFLYADQEKDQIPPFQNIYSKLSCDVKKSRFYSFIQFAKNNCAMIRSTWIYSYCETREMATLFT